MKEHKNTHRGAGAFKSKRETTMVRKVAKGHAFGVVEHDDERGYSNYFGGIRSQKTSWLPRQVEVGIGWLFVR